MSQNWEFPRNFKQPSWPGPSRDWRSNCKTRHSSWDVARGRCARLLRLMFAPRHRMDRTEPDPEWHYSDLKRPIARSRETVHLGGDIPTCPPPFEWRRNTQDHQRWWLSPSNEMQIIPDLHATTPGGRADGARPGSGGGHGAPAHGDANGNAAPSRGHRAYAGDAHRGRGCAHAPVARARARENAA